MKPSKPLFLKTYGKERRKLSAWISPENRKQAFDSTCSTDGDAAVCEPAKPPMRRVRKTSVASRRALRPAKKRALLCLAEKSSTSDEETPPPPSCPRPVQQSKTTRERRTGVARRRAGGHAKKKANLCLADTSIDENISPFCPQPAQQSKTSSDHLLSAGRFVTRRRHAAATKHQLPKSTFSMLNSSDDFTSGALTSWRILRARRVPPSNVVSSAENSMNAAGTACFAINPFREISLNESTDHSLGPCPRKPIFCSTPSAGSFSKRPRLKPLSINDQSSTPPSMSVSYVGVFSTSQEDVDSPGQRISAPCSAPPIGHHSGEKLLSSLGEQEPDRQPGITNKTSSCSVEAKSYGEDTKTKNAEELPSLSLLSTDDNKSRSRFVSAAGGSGWLTEALKEKCLTEHCSVQLERLDSIFVSQLSGHTTYSSCLGHSSSAHSQQTSEQPLSVDSCQTFDILRSSESSFDLHLSATNMETNDYIQSVNSFESSEHVASAIGSQSANNSPSAEHSSAQESMAQPESVLYAESTYHKDSSVESLMDTQLPANSSVQTPFAVALKEKSLTKKCTGKLQKNSLSPQNTDPNNSGNDYTQNIEEPENLTSYSPIAQTLSKDPETEERAALLTKTLKEKCLTDKAFVGVKRVTCSQLKEILQLKDTFIVPPDASDSASEDQTKCSHRSESDTYPCKEINMKKRGSTSSKNNVASDKEEFVKNSSNISHKGKKTHLAPKEKKRRSTSTDRPGTTRKACVSGLSVSRWKNKSSASTHGFRTGQTGGNKAVDCSINELISTQPRQPRELLGTTINFSTPMRASRLNLSSLLADFTPNTHTWSRLKAALSVHRKGMVLCTPSSLPLSESGSPRRVKLADISQDLFATPLRTPLPKHLRSQLLSRNSTVAFEDADLSDAEKVYAECGQQCPLPWEECILPHRMKRCVKIGEGTFGEVFSTTNASGDTVALKIIPVEGSEKVNGEDQKTLGEILHEIIISKELSSLKEKLQNKTHGFIGLNDLHCVQGCYPPDFLNAWDIFDQQKGSENDRPDFFEKDQLFIILEFEFGGVDLENSNGTLTSLGVAKSILHQVTAALAVAEQELHFEHRDLHWGNVLVKTTKQKTGSFLLNGAAHSLETKGVLVRIIDYSLSRLEIDGLTVSCDISEDEELFMGQGDYQFEIYRQMRQENGNNWCNYHPHTNVLWLHYLCSKLLSMKYRGSGGRGVKGMREELTRFHGNVLQYSSATEALQNCPMFH
ncbi:serine/threonine-protein kinase haspin isoform X1 [Etheostoma cragini]|uniref:serine/threonine-protein kinase haspin isoform X1 n=1 Tax=Etheostoma cragini TaxID=417921 RepID=UPI00155EDEF0|nr:serine/threonine-protein kinase haspin isoform X1 [Etheostoma cragini]